MTDDRVLREILTKYRRVAVVGMSKNPEKEAHTVPKYLIDRGYDVVPVNPTATEILGRRAYPDLTSVLGGDEILDLFQPSAAVSAGVGEAIPDGQGQVAWAQLWVSQGPAGDQA